MGETMTLVTSPNESPKFPPKNNLSLKLGGSSHPDPEAGKARQDSSRMVVILEYRIRMSTRWMGKIIKFLESVIFTILISLLTLIL